MGEAAEHMASEASTPSEVCRRAADLGEAGAHERSLALLDHALGFHPGHAALHTARGWALENLSPPRWDEARRAYEAAIALDAEDLWAHLGLASVLGQLGESVQCAPIYRDLVERARRRASLEPEYFELLGWCQYRLGRLDDAAATFRHALTLDGAWASVRFDLALVLLLSGQSHSADLHYGHTVRLLSKRGSEATLGAVRVALDDLDEALRVHPWAAAAAAPARQRLVEALQPTVTEHA